MNRLLRFGNVDFGADDGQILVTALQYYPSIVDAYISTGDFKEYIKSGNRVRNLADALYEHVRRTKNTDLFTRMIRYDNRDKQHSVAYLKAFRQAVMDNEYDLADAIFREVPLSVDLVADVLQIDSPAVFSQPGYLDLKEWNAYLVAMQEMKEKDAEFFAAYVSYRILNYSSDQELLANLVAADDPELLWLVGDVPAKVLLDYVTWKYSEPSLENTPAQIVSLVSQLGRLPKSASESRGMMYEVLELQAKISRDPHIIRQMGDAREQGWPDYQDDVRRTELARIREIIAAAEQAGIHVQGDAVYNIDMPLSKERANGRIGQEAVRIARKIVKERFKRLPEIA